MGRAEKAYDIFVLIPDEGGGKNDFMIMVIWRIYYILFNFLKHCIFFSSFNKIQNILPKNLILFLILFHFLVVSGCIQIPSLALCSPNILHKNYIHSSKFSVSSVPLPIVWGSILSDLKITFIKLFFFVHLFCNFFLNGNYYFSESSFFFTICNRNESNYYLAKKGELREKYSL